MKPGLTIILFIFCICCAPLLFAQQADSDTGEDVEVVVETGITPIFPVRQTNLIHVEGEDAVSTNFNREPVLNYDCSGLQTLQLSRKSGVQAGRAFFAEFVFFVEEAGSYQFWYGGTPPGPSDERLSSYASPFTYILDNNDPVNVYESDVEIASQYSPSYYWNYTGTVDLEAGRHRLRFEVSEKRRYDDRYYFYLDSFFMARSENGKPADIISRPDVFPDDLTVRKISMPLLSIEEYEVNVRDNPRDVPGMIFLSKMYTMVNDYLNAIRFLNNVRRIDPDNQEAMELLAKNRIWRGEIDRGLELYEDLLEADPGRLDIWNEAGKIAAWTAQFDASESFFKRGLSVFPENLSLTVNLALTYMWKGEAALAEKTRDKALAIAKEDTSLMFELARQYALNGYAGRAENVYKRIINNNPRVLEAWIKLDNLYFKTGSDKKSRALKEQIRTVFVESPELESYLQTSYEKQQMKELVIQEYENELAENPDNLELRSIVALTYIWNGYIDRGIQEYIDTFVNHIYNKLHEMDQNNMPYLEFNDRLLIYQYYYNNYIELMKEQMEVLASAGKEFSQAKKSFESSKKDFLNNGGTESEMYTRGFYTNWQNTQTETSNTINSVKNVLAQFANFDSSLEIALQPLDQLIMENREQRDEFNSIFSSIGWTWNRSETMRDLDNASAKSSYLANFSVARLLLAEGRPEASHDASLRITSQNIRKPDVQYLQFQYGLRSGKPDLKYLTQESPAVEYAPHLIMIKNTVNELISAQFHNNTFHNADELTGEIDTLMKTLSAVRDQADSRTKDISRVVKKIDGIMTEKMTRYMYLAQENTYLLKNELGDFYLTLDQPAEAIYRYKQVLQIDPWNIEAMYKLGRAAEWQGDWKRALDNYKEVFYNNPQYQNVTNLYNNLSSLHPDRSRFSAEIAADPDSTNYNVSYHYSTEITSNIGASFMYEGDFVRRFKVTQSGEDEGSYQVHGFAAGLPWTAVLNKFVITLYAGGEFSSILDYNEAAPNETIFIDDYVKQIKPYFMGGVNFLITPNEFARLQLGYKYAMEEETFMHDRTDRYAHEATLSFNGSFGFLTVPVLRHTSFRSAVEGNFITDGNIVYRLTQEAEIKFPFQDSSSFSLTGSGSLEDSVISDSSANYYTPDTSITLKGGPKIYKPFELGGPNSFAVEIYGNGGVNLVPPRDEQNLNIDFGTYIELYRIRSAYFINAYGSFSFAQMSFDNPSYWSFSISLGYSGISYSFLTP